MDAFDFARIKRIVLLVDLHPLLVLENPNPYISNIQAAVRRILSFPALASCLTSFKLFFSSLSPIQCSSKLRHLLGKYPTSLYFDRPLQTLDSLLNTLSSLSSIHDHRDIGQSACPSASLIAGSLLQLINDYAWEPQIRHSSGVLDNLLIRSNLVFLFSPIRQTPDFFCEFSGEVSFPSSDMLLRKFLDIFVVVKDRLVSRDIHVSWIDVHLDPSSMREKLGLEFLGAAIKHLGWSCYRAEAIVLGSALIPFGLIFPYIACTMDFKCSSSLRKNHAELILGIKDVDGITLERKSCDLEVVTLKVSEETSDIPCLHSLILGNGGTKICIREVRDMNEGIKAIEKSCAMFILHRTSGSSQDEKEEGYRRQDIAHKVLELLSYEQGMVDSGKLCWQLILTFLFRRNYSALVSVVLEGGYSVGGILHPFTSNHALLAIFPAKFDVPLSTDRLYKGCRREQNNEKQSLLQDVSWTSFCEMVLNQSFDITSEIDLEELYFDVKCTRSKKLQFLQCWMEQIKNSFDCCDGKENNLKLSSIVKDMGEEYSGSQQESDRASPADGNCTNKSKIQQAKIFLDFENSNNFLGCVPQKIEQALCSKEVDLSILAERMVVSSIHALYSKQKWDATQKCKPGLEQDALDTEIATELCNLLLIKPKDLELRCKNSNASFLSGPSTIIYDIEAKIRAHELQILFRLEMLRSMVASTFNQNLKQKLIKDICSLLQNIEFYLQGDFLGGESLLEFVKRIIKSRYEHSLPNVIHEIYDRMEFFSFDEDGIEASDPVPESNKDSLKRDNNVSTKMMPSNEDPLKAQQILESTLEKQVMEAQVKRNKARRISSFTSWVPDLQRVWALRHPMPEKQARESVPRIKPRKRKKRPSSTYYRVCETP
ncbi:hypothetical protein HPP92_005221 [Vanilla planifolia]|uniref:Treslin STD domain-containing protein n=1 Tax=Vanilla planifolia TaxID=51239 RepID=A0A835RTG1_VANPL|nr:hypothetical protein HPP92_005221 [Vanilla planifolia]